MEQRVLKIVNIQKSLVTSYQYESITGNGHPKKLTSGTDIIRSARLCIQSPIFVGLFKGPWLFKTVKNLFQSLGSKHRVASALSGRSLPITLHLGAPSRHSQCTMYGTPHQTKTIDKIQDLDTRQLKSNFIQLELLEIVNKSTIELSKP
jgi:hypothetical protein